MSNTFAVVSSLLLAAVQAAEYQVAIHGYLRFAPDPAMAKAATRTVTSALLSVTQIAETGYSDYDGKPLVIDKDYLGKPRAKPFPGPFESLEAKIRVW